MCARRRIAQIGRKPGFSLGIGKLGVDAGAEVKRFLFPRGVGDVIPVIVVLFSSILAAAAPKVDSWDRWTAHEPGHALGFNHGKWRSFPDKYLDTTSKDVDLVRYG